MSDKAFIDTNICVYLFDKDLGKAETARQLLENANVIISTQVIAELINTLIKKLKFTKKDAIETARFMMVNTTVKPVTPDVLNKAFDICLKYGFRYFDCMIVSAALLNDCSVLYSEDLHHNQKIEKRLTIKNPFKKL